MARAQIRSYISDTTKELVDRYVQAHGVKRGRLLEEALLYHLQALRELPTDLIIPPRLVVGRETLKAMRALMAGKAGRAGVGGWLDAPMSVRRE